MKKILILLLCLLFIVQASAKDISIDDKYTVVVDKEAVLAALMEADIPSIRKALDLKLITCTELTEFYLERINAYDDIYQCFITLCDDALEIAAQRDAAIADGTAEGALFGIPVVVKDNIDYAGYPTSNGQSKGYWRYPTENAPVVQYLIDEGAVILGKTNMSAEAQDALRSISDCGFSTANAYDPDLASGGSSGGSAVAVSLNFAAAALGTDTNASLRYPAALNGCVTIRPTHGLVEDEGSVHLSASRDTIGAITRNVTDQAIMLDVITGGVYQYAEKLNPNALKGMRIGVLVELAYPIENSYNRKSSDLDDEIEAAFETALQELTDCGAEIVPVSIEKMLDYISANRLSSQLYAQLEEVLSENDLSCLIYPTYFHTPHNTSKEVLNGKSVYDLPYICNCATISPLTGAPELSVQIGQHTSGAGIGMEIVSLKNSEQLLLDIAYSYTENYYHRQMPQDAAPLHSGEQEITLEHLLELYEAATEQAAALKIETSKPKQVIQTEPIAEEPAPVVEIPEAKNSYTWHWFLLLPLACAPFIGIWLYKKHKNFALSNTKSKS